MVKSYLVCDYVSVVYYYTLLLSIIIVVLLCYLTVQLYYSCSYYNSYCVILSVIY